MFKAQKYGEKNKIWNYNERGTWELSMFIHVFNLPPTENRTQFRFVQIGGVRFVQIGGDRPIMKQDATIPSNDSPVTRQKSEAVFSGCPS